MEGRRASGEDDVDEDDDEDDVDEDEDEDDVIIIVMWMNWHDSTSPGFLWVFGIQCLASNGLCLFCNFIWYLLIFSFFIKSITISFNESYHITKLSHIYNLGPNLAMNAWTRGSDFKIFLAAAVTLLLFSARA